MDLLTYHPLLSPFNSIYISLTPLTTYEENGGGEVDSYMIEMSIGETDSWSLVH